MQINAMYINHFLSFEKFAWEGLDQHLNVIVVPNGAGKSNLFHALRAVRDALSIDRTQATARWIDAKYQGSDADTITISLDLQFTTASEQRMLCVFLATLLCDQREISQIVTTTTKRNVDPNRLRQFAAWMLEHVRPDDVSWLFSGRLTVTRSGSWGWQCTYESLPGKSKFQIDLTSGETLFGHAEHSPQTSTQNWGPLFIAWRNHLTEQERTQLDQGLTDVTSEASFPKPDFSHLPDWVSSQQGIGLQIGDQTQIVDPATLATRRAFASAMQFSLEPGRYIGMRFVFQRLLDHTLVFTDNVRLLPRSTFLAKNLLAQPLDLSNGEELARFLYCKKNRKDQDRKQYAAIQEMFWRMTNRTFDVVLGSVTTEGSQQEPPPDTSLEVVISGSWKDIPLEFSGAGIAEALFLCAVLAGSTGQVVLLDEPALNLHPPMQVTLLQELQTLARMSAGKGNQFLVNTHTPYLVPPDSIESISRFTLQDGHTIRHALAGSQKQRDKINVAKLQNLLRINLAARALLFSRAVILVEGETELGAFPVWYPDLVRQDIAIYSVGGKGQFVSPLKFIRDFSIPWAIICDGDALWDKKQRNGFVKAILNVCDQTPPRPSGTPGSNPHDFIQWSQSLEKYGIFTLASAADEGFEKAIKKEIQPKLWASAEEEFNSNKVARGRFLAEKSPCPQKLAELLQKVTHYLLSKV